VLTVFQFQNSFWNVATIYHALGIDQHATITDRVGRPVPILPGGEPIPVF
jgi:hypothetical protein